MGNLPLPSRRQSLRDRITVSISLRLPRSEHSAQAQTLDMQEVTGSSPVSPTIHDFVIRSGSMRANSADRITTALADRLTAQAELRARPPAVLSAC
jgi:hypothetical protein